MTAVPCAPCFGGAHDACWRQPCCCQPSALTPHYPGQETPMTWDGLTPPYRTIVADPPWSYNASVKELRSGGRGGQAEHQYGTLSNADIAALPVKSLAADESHLYLWVTVPRLFGERNGSRVTGPIEIVESWGFQFKTMLTWIKPGAGGMGWYFRGQTEHVIFATRGGAGIPAAKREPNVFEAARHGHSEKPAAFFDIVERVSPGPYVELFARSPRLGWDHWGHGFELADSVPASSNGASRPSALPASIGAGTVIPDKRYQESEP